MKKCRSFLVLIFSFIHSSAQKLEVDVTSARKDDKSIDFNYTKSGHGNYTILLKFNSLVNAHALNKPIIVDRLSGKLMTLKPVDNQRHISMSGYSFLYVRGFYKPKVDEKFVYAIPFKKGTETAVAMNKESISFKPAINDTVFGARKGYVIDKAVIGQVNHEYQTYSQNKNGILVEHADGTIASYEGFETDGIFVNVGDKIYPQQAIGILQQDGRLDLTVKYLMEADFLGQKVKAK
jgi:hypothetical protein